MSKNMGFEAVISTNKVRLLRLLIVIFVSIFLVAYDNPKKQMAPIKFTEGKQHRGIIFIKNINGKIAYKTSGECGFRHGSADYLVPLIAYTPLMFLARCNDYILIDGWRQINGKGVLGPYNISNKLAYTVADGPHTRELIWDGKSAIEGLNLKVVKEGKVGIVSVSSGYHIVNDSQVYGPYAKVWNASLVADELFFSVASSNKATNPDYHYFNGEKLGDEFNELIVDEYAWHQEKIAYIGKNDDGMYVVLGEKKYGPYEVAFSLTTTSSGLAWIAREAGDEFVVMDGVQWERYEYYPHDKKKIYTIDDKVIYQGVKEGRHYLIINKDAVEYGDRGQASRAIDKLLDPYLANQYKLVNKLKFSNDTLEIEGEKYQFGSELRQNHLQSSDKRYDQLVFTLLKFGDRYFWTTWKEEWLKATLHISGEESREYDSIGLFRVIGGRLVFAATRGDKAGLVIDGEEKLDYELPPVDAVYGEPERYILNHNSYNPDDPYVPLDFNGRIVFKAYRDGSYFIVEEQHRESGTLSERQARIIFSH